MNNEMAEEIQRLNEQVTYLQMMSTQQVADYRLLQRKFDEIIAIVIASKIPVRTITEEVVHPQIKLRDRLLDECEEVLDVLIKLIPDIKKMSKVKAIMNDLGGRHGQKRICR